MQTSINLVQSYLIQNDIKLSSRNEWLQECFSWYISSNPQAQQDEVNKFVYEQWLLSDLRDISESCLPRERLSDNCVILDGKYALQVNSVLNVGKSCYSQLLVVKNVATGNLEVTTEEAKPWEPKPHRMLKLECTDGLSDVYGMEYRPIPAFTEPFVPGRKILVTGPVECRKGVLLLEAHHVKILGGETDSLIIKNCMENILSRMLKLPENANPIKVEKVESSDRTNEVLNSQHAEQRCNNASNPHSNNKSREISVERELFEGDDDLLISELDHIENTILASQSDEEMPMITKDNELFGPRNSQILQPKENKPIVGVACQIIPPCGKTSTLKRPSTSPNFSNQRTKLPPRRSEIRLFEPITSNTETCDSTARNPVFSNNPYNSGDIVGYGNTNDFRHPSNSSSAISSSNTEGSRNAKDSWSSKDSIKANDSSNKRDPGIPNDSRNYKNSGNATSLNTRDSGYATTSWNMENSGNAKSPRNSDNSLNLSDANNANECWKSEDSAKEPNDARSSYITSLLKNTSNSDVRGVPKSDNYFSALTSGAPKNTSFGGTPKSDNYFSTLTSGAPKNTGFDATPKSGNYFSALTSSGLKNTGFDGTSDVSRRAISLNDVEQTPTSEYKSTRNISNKISTESERFLQDNLNDSRASPVNKSLELKEDASAISKICDVLLNLPASECVLRFKAFAHQPNSKPQIRNGVWNMSISIKDETGLLDVNISNELMEGLVMPVSEMMKCKEKINKFPDVAQKVNSDLKEACQKIRKLKGICEVKFSPALPLPILMSVIN